MVDSRPKIDGFEIEDLVKELNAASRCLKKLSRAQMQAALAAEPLAESLSKIAVAADAVGIARLGVLAEAGRTALGSLDAANPSVFNIPSLEQTLAGMRQMAKDIRRSLSPGISPRERVGFKGAAAGQVAEPPMFRPASDENLLAAREEMMRAREKALDAAQLMPMDALALRVQRLAAIAQDERARTTDLSPVSSAWLAVPVLSAQLSRDLGKQIRIEVMGEDIFVERRLIPIFATCVEQLVRSAAEHGLELAARRGLSRKPAAGTVTIMASCDQMGLSLTVADDGNGEYDASSLEFVTNRVAALGGGVEVVSVPDWGSSVTLALPGPALGAWRLQVTPRSMSFANMSFANSKNLSAAPMTGARSSQAAQN